MASPTLPGELVERCPPEARPALAILADHHAVVLRQGPDEIEIWVETESGKRVKAGGCGFTGDSGLYLSHVFVVTRRLTEAATSLGFSAELAAAGRRFWTLDEAAPPARFAEALTAFLGLEDGPRPTGAIRARLPLRTETLLEAQAMAFVGAAEGGTNSTSLALASLRRAGFEGRLLPIGPAEGEHADEAATVIELASAGKAELAVLAADTPALGETLKGLATAGTRVALVLPPDDPNAEGGLALDRELADIAEETGIAVLGPDAGGLIHAPSRIATGPGAASMPIMPIRDGSGGAFAAIIAGESYAAQLVGMSAKRSIAPRSMIGIGRGAGIGFAEALHLLLGDSGAAGLPILAIVEKAPDRPGEGQALAAALAKARVKRRPVLVVRADRRGPDDRLGAVLSASGALEITSLEAGLDIVQACRMRRLPQGARVGLAADRRDLAAIEAQLTPAAAELGLSLEPLPLSPGAPSGLGRELTALLSSRGRDLLLGVWRAPGHEEAPQVLEALAEAAEAAWDQGPQAPVFLHAAFLPDDMQALVDNAQIPVVPDASRALAAAAALIRIGAGLSEAEEQPPRLPLRARLPEAAEDVPLKTLVGAALPALGLPASETGSAEIYAQLSFEDDAIWGSQIVLAGSSPSPQPGAGAHRLCPFGVEAARLMALEAGLGEGRAAALAEALARFSVFCAVHAARLGRLETSLVAIGEGAVATSGLVIGRAPCNELTYTETSEGEGSTATDGAAPAETGTR
ncbi:MAG: hypothetical protein AAGG47_04120 [Pseudomonadota bacterium]